MTAAITAACEGSWRVAVPTEAGLGLVQALPAPDEAATLRFSEQLRAARGRLRSVSLVNQEISGSPMSPTVTTALVLDFEGGSATGSARLQWLPAATDREAQWLPTARLLELDVSTPQGTSLTLKAPNAAQTSEPEAPPPTP